MSPCSDNAAQAGGANWPPSSYDPETHRLYVCATQQIQMFRARPTGGAGPEMAPQKPLGILAAMDMTTNKIVWRRQWGDQCYSGTAVTKGGLVFLGRNDGRFMAFDKTSGQPALGIPDRCGRKCEPGDFRA